MTHATQSLTLADLPHWPYLIYDPKTMPHWPCLTYMGDGTPIRVPRRLPWRSQVVATGRIGWIKGPKLDYHIYEGLHFDIAPLMLAYRQCSEKEVKLSGITDPKNAVRNL